MTSSRAALIPWTWYIHSSYSDHECPSITSTLTTFALVNALGAIVGLLFGHRKVVKRITCGCFGKEDGGETWWFTFIFPLCLHFGANVLVAFLYRLPPGSGQGFNIGDLILFYTTRPRFGWIILSVLMLVGKDDSQKIRGYYEAAAKGTQFAEFFLLMVSTYYTGMTAHFASTRGYYISGRLQGPLAYDAHMMYAGALMSLISLAGTILYLLTLLFNKDHNRTWLYTSVWGIASSTWVASWVFWIGYVRLAGDL